MSGRPVASIAVIGGGIAAWAAAGALAARLPGVAVTVVEDGAVPPSLVDLASIASPSIVDFHADLRFEEAPLMRQVDAVYRLGARYVGWRACGGAYLHTHGEEGPAMAGAPFHQHWLRLEPEAGEFSDYAIGSALARAGRFAHPSLDPQSPLSRFGYGFQLDAAKYRDALRLFALSRGVTAVGADPAVVLAEGRVVALGGEGSRIEADIYVDTIGTVAARLDDRRVDWSHWLPAKYLLRTSHSLAGDPALVERVVAGPTGWRLEAPLRSRTVALAVDAEPIYGAGEAHRFAQGRRVAPWTGNVVAIGEAAVTVEPLEGANLHLVHAHVDRIIAGLPGADLNPVEIADYNRQTVQEADRLRDFIILLYRLAGRTEPMWRDLAATVPPPELERDLLLFRDRGHLPVHDGESFQPNSRLSVLIGAGVRPRRVDPVAAELPRPEGLAALGAFRETIDRAVGQQPTHAAYLARKDPS